MRVALAFAVSIASIGGPVVVGCRAHEATPRTLRARTPSGAELRWTVEEVVLEPIAPAPDSGVGADDLLDALGQEVVGWNEALRGCAAPRLRMAALAANGAARDDGRNVVVLRTGRWCPADSFGLHDCYDPAKRAITHLRPRLDGDRGRGGEIREADVELNAVDFRWSVDGDGPATASLRGVLGHELGHVLGLDHSCVPRADSSRNEVRCDAASLRSSIMFPDAPESGRSLPFEPTDDAIATLCSPRSVGERLAGSWP